MLSTKTRIVTKRLDASQLSCRFQHRFSSSVAATAAASIDEDDEFQKDHRPTTPPLLEFRKARLAYPRSKVSSKPFDFAIHPPDLKTDARQGGYAVLGRNGSGKSLLGAALRATVDGVDLSKSGGNHNNPYVVDGTLTFSRWHSRAVAHVSFDSHRELLRERDEKTGEHVTAFKAIAAAGGAPGKLNPAAQFLVVRFGLYPLLHRTVDTLSTGEIRKVLLIRALSQRPKLLVLDNAFDGLDVPSRDILKELVSKTIKGFTNDILVQGVNSKATARTQIVLMTHRAEEIVDEVDSIAWWEHDKDTQSSTFQLIKRYIGDGESSLLPSLHVLHQSLGMEKPVHHNGLPQYDWNDPELPSVGDVDTWWKYGDNHSTTDNNDSIVVKADDLSIRRGNTTLLYSLDWTVHTGERWIVGGGNGAGKSSLSRLLANHEYLDQDARLNLQILPHGNPGNPRSSAVGWVSTESHLKHHEEEQRHAMTVRGYLVQEAESESWDHVITPVLSWLKIATTPVEQEALSNTSFHDLSQGQQKMILLAAAIAKRPPLLVLDEPCQGLDLVSRQCLLQVVERICAATDMSLIYITHHLDEEQIPSITHAMHLKDRTAVFQGSIEEYDPSFFYTNSN
jgi:molybdate transport system ATP-binding protein